MTESNKWEWSSCSKEMLDWIAKLIPDVPDVWDETDDDEIDPIAVMGRIDTRSDLVDAITSDGRRGMKWRDRPDLARRHFISRAESPVANFFEKKEPEWTRQQQIEAYRDYVWNEWLQKGNIPERADKWLRARAAELNAGGLIDLVSDSRDFSRRRGGGAWGQKAPYDCHGHVIRALILIVAGQITKDDYFANQAEYLLKVEGYPVGSDWKREAKELIASRKTTNDDSTSDPWSE